MINLITGIGMIIVPVIMFITGLHHPLAYIAPVIGIANISIYIKRKRQSHAEVKK